MNKSNNKNITENTTTNKGEIEMNKLTVTELKEVAKGLGLKGYSSLRKAELVEFINNSKKEEEPVETELEVLGSIFEGEDAVEEVTEEPVSETVEEEEKVKVGNDKYPIGSYVQHLKNKRVFRITEYVGEGASEKAKAVFRLNITKPELLNTTISVKHLNNPSSYNAISGEDVVALMKGQATPTKEETPAPEVKPVVNGIHPSVLKNYKVDVIESKGNKQFYLTNKETNGSVKVDHGKSVSHMINTYETTINGLKIQVTEKGNFNKEVLHECACCKQNKVTVEHKAFLKRNQVALPEEYRNKDFCYDCQKKLNITKVIKAAAKQRNAK